MDAIQTKAERQTSVEIRELLAFELEHLDKDGKVGLYAPAADEWRRDAEARKAARIKADLLIQSLDDYGIKVSASDSRLVKKSIDELLTIPAVKAYKLED